MHVVAAGTCHEECCVEHSGRIAPEELVALDNGVFSVFEPHTVTPTIVVACAITELMMAASAVTLPSGWGESAVVSTQHFAKSESF